MSDQGPEELAARPESSVFVPRPWALRSAIWIAVLTFLISLLGSVAIREVLSRDLTDAMSSLLVGGTLTLGYLIELAIVGSVAASYGTSFAAAVGLVRPRGDVFAWAALAIGGALAARAFAAVYGLIIESLELNVPGIDSDAMSAFPGTGVSVVVLLVVVVLFAPFAEEVIFRGVMLPVMGARWGTVAGLAASSVLFAAFHVSVYLFLPILVAAFIFGGVTIRFKSLWPAYLAHATFNFIAAAAVLILKARGLA